MKMQFSRSAHLAALLLLVVFFSGCVTRNAPHAPEIASRVGTLSSREASNLRVFDAAWDLTNRKFHDAKFRGVDWSATALAYGPKAVAAPDEERLYGVINGMLGELKESHNWASSPKDLADRADLPRTRVGISLGLLENRWIVLDVLPDSPAAEAGVKRGWIFVSRNGRTLGKEEDFTLKDAETVVDVYLDAQEKTHALTMTPRLLRFREWHQARELEGGVRYLRFDGFDRASRRWLSEQLKAYREAPAVIVDLRRNGGGSAFSMEIVVGEFFSKKVGWGRFTGRSGRTYDGDSWQWGSAHYSGKVAVLVDATSASSAEIFAHVLQSQHRAVIVGRKTAGAVIGSRMYRLPDGGELQLGVFDYQNPDGHRLEGAGVIPDIAVPAAYDGIDGFRADRDLDLAAALTALKADETLRQ